MTPQEQKIVQYLVRGCGRELAAAVARLGGKRARQGLHKAFDTALADRGLAAGDRPFEVSLDGADWDDGAALLAALIEHAAGLIGSHTVEREMTRLLDATDARAGGSQYEIYFRLGLHGYRQD